MQRKIRVLVGKPGLDGHDRGAKVVAAALRDAGMEVIYTGLHQTPAQVVEAAAQEDVDVVALSILSGAHMTLFPEVMKLMRSRGIGDRLLTGGGIIPADDMASLARQGVGRLFGPGASTQDIAHYIREWFQVTHGGEAAPPRASAARAPVARPKSAARGSGSRRRPAGKREPAAKRKAAAKRKSAAKRKPVATRSAKPRRKGR
jgi:methylmalonyl-CoA mutase, C-terminal domain